MLKMRLLFTLLTLCLFSRHAYSVTDETCEKGETKSSRYLLYTVNPGEGFNLRRDVYIRVANLVRKLNEVDHWTLVLPPWGHLYHWKNMPPRVYVPWSHFFDVSSLNRWIPVMEFNQYLEVAGTQVESLYFLQRYAEGWEGGWEEKFDRRPCIERHQFKEVDDSWRGVVWGKDIKIQKFACLSIQGQASTLLPLIAEEANTRSIFFARAETVLHDDFWGTGFWDPRRSMRFATHLRVEAARYRKDVLDSEDLTDGTKMTEDWRDFKPKRGAAIGGPYIAVHLRRRDFIRAKGDEVPSLKRAAHQIIQALREKNLTTVFIATDAPKEEFEELQSLVPEYKVVRYEASPDFFQQWGDGGTAIVDQIICSHARHFIGSHDSTFSYRIQEEREILGFPVESTFNRLCGKKSKCEQPAKWKIVY